MTIDAHHHLWRFHAEEFGWLEGALAPLRRDYLVPDLHEAMHSAGVGGSVAVQARQTLEETHWLLDLAEQTPEIHGVVGWAPLADVDFLRTLEPLLQRRHLKGLRHVVQAEPDPEFLLGAAFNRGIAALQGTGLAYDLLVFERQLPQAIRFVDQHPNQAFVLDHIAKPRIAEGHLEPWKTNLRELARRPNVVCKVSGMVTEADPHGWTPGQLRPYLDVVVEAFTAARLLAGSDWPVCLAGCTYAAWFQVLREYFASYSPSENDAIFARNALQTYNLAAR